jgi:hypothetical protein
MKYIKISQRSHALRRLAELTCRTVADANNIRSNFYAMYDAGHTDKEVQTALQATLQQISNPRFTFTVIN